MDKADIPDKFVMVCRSNRIEKRFKERKFESHWYKQMTKEE